MARQGVDRIISDHALNRQLTDTERLSEMVWSRIFRKDILIALTRVRRAAFQKGRISTLPLFPPSWTVI